MRVLLVAVLVSACAGYITYPNAYVGGIQQPPLEQHKLVGRDLKAQLQPAGHDNFVHGMPSFFHNELIYVENDLVLVWTPSTGEWRTHAIHRECGLDCPILDELPTLSGVWPDRKFRKLIFMGCHHTTNHGHMLVVDPATGNYTIDMYEHETADPMTKVMARCRRLEMTQFQMIFMGKDELLMYEPNTAEYKVFLVEPRLPMMDGQDPIGPFEPLDEGKHNMHEQQVYVGNDYLFDYSATTGEYFIHKYDRTVMIDESPFKQVVKSGYLDRDMQLTYIGSHQMIGFNPMNGSYKAFNLTEDMDIVMIEGSGHYYGFGSILTGEVCADRSSCKTCLKRAGCGWCETNARCMRGALAGPCGTNCTVWDMNVCPGEPCYTHKECSLCLQDPFCGWCADTGTCSEGTLAGPLFGSCNFSKFVCPVYTPPPGEPDTRCNEEIE